MSQYLIAHIGHTNKETEHITWWNPNSRGYTFCIEKAGRYDLAEATSICRDGLCVAVMPEDAQALSRSTPYYRRMDGTLNKLYDGGPHRVVPNSIEAWTHLKAHRLDCGRHDKPTPISAKKARAIYITEGGAS